MITKEILKEVIESQREWILSIKQGIKRKELSKIDLISGFALVISGIRRCGKSTFLSQILKQQKKFYYLNLEDPRLEGFEVGDFNRAESVFEEMYGKKGIYFFDEIQNVLEWEKFIRYLTDRKNKMIITGSNASLLSKELGTRLTGRHLNLEMFPFSYNEFLNFFGLKNNKESFEKYLYKGGFPEFLRENNEELLRELFNDVVIRDVVNRFGIRNASLLKKIAVYLTSHVGKEFSYNSIKNAFQIKSVQTVIDYISYFEDSYLLFTVPRFDYSFKKQQVNPKKIYSIDNGFSHANSVTFSKDKGKQLENSVFLELRRRSKEIFYFQEKHECDFVIKDKNKINQVIQVCYMLEDENKDREINGLVEAMEKFGLKKGLILTFDQKDKFMVDGKEIIIRLVRDWMIEGN